MSRRPPPYWLNRGGAPSAKSKAAASSRDAAIQSFNSFYAQLLREQHDGFTESKGGGGDDDGDGDDAAGKRKAAAFSQQMRERVLRFFMRGVRAAITTARVASSQHRPSPPPSPSLQPRSLTPPCLLLASVGVQSKESAYYTVHGAAAYFVADEYFNTRVEMRSALQLTPRPRPGLRHAALSGCSTVPPLPSACVARFLGDDRLAWLNLRPAKVASIVSDAVQVKKMQVEVWDKQQGQWICTLKVAPTPTHARLLYNWSCSHPCCFPLLCRARPPTRRSWRR